MKYTRYKKNKFHIDKRTADELLAKIYRNCDREPVNLSDEAQASLMVTVKPKKDPYLPLITCCIAMMLILLFSFILILLPDEEHMVIDEERLERARIMADPTTYDTSTLTKGARDNTPLCLVPTMDGTDVYSNDVVTMDASNMNDGYVILKYTGASNKVKLRIKGPDEITYTYNMATGGGLDEVFPLQAGDGTYLVGVFENLEGTSYATAFSQEIDVKLNDPFLPFLYPNQYITFTKDYQSIAYAEYLSYTADTDLDVVSNVYNALISSMTYDYEEAQTVESGYIPEIDEVLTTGKGICIDYACLMTSMLRSQRIPTRMEVGYAGTAYHAWLSTYIEDIGWVNGMIEFDVKDWSLMDPTFASTTDTDKLASFIGDGENYKTKYIY